MTEKNSSSHIHPIEHSVSREEREILLDQKSFVLWFTGLSGAGKTTLANYIQNKLFEAKYLCYMLDGDNIRKGLCADLGFSSQDRDENIRRIGEVSALLADSAAIVLSSFISPLIQQREQARKIIGDRFVEVFCDCSLEKCEERDIKGLYKKARDGIIPEFTGISSPYEKPPNPEIRIDTAKLTIDESARQILDKLVEWGYLPVK